MSLQKRFNCSNPATENVTLQLPEGISSGTIRVTSLTGQHIMQQAAQATTSLDIGALPAGMYLVSLHREGQPVTQQKLLVY